MSSVIMTGVGLSVGFTIGNLIYQSYSKKDYRKALERSYFQTAAIMVFAIMQFMK